MMRHLLLVLIPVIFLTFCKTQSAVTAPPAPYSPDSQQLAVAQQRWPGTTETELRDGNTIYTTKCTRCHKNYKPEKFSEKKWLHELDDMAPKAKLTDLEKQSLTRYLLTSRQVASAK
jgi:hypothetical protein